MAKIATTIEQSKLLAEILPLESADMCYLKREINDTFIETPIVKPKGDVLKSLPCWSLAALLGVLPNNKRITTTLSRGGWKIEPVEYIDKWFCEYEDEDSPSKNFSASADNPVDACVAMIERLHELNLL